MGILGKLHILTLMGIISHIELLHLCDLTLPHTRLFINQHLIDLILMFNQLAIAQIDHTYAETLRGTMGITEFQPLRALEGCYDIVGDITFGISIPSRAILR